MPIIKPCNAAEFLGQGDILQGVPLAVTVGTNNIAPGEVKATKHGLCLVISRPCVAVNKAAVTVAAIDKHPSTIPKEAPQGFDETLGYLEELRGGYKSPDVFYLGQLEGQEGRFCARFDSLHTIQVPKDAGERAAFVAARRVGRLSIDFIRDLHVRLTTAFMSMGFDDHKWLTDDDLDWLVTAGKRSIGDAEASLAQKNEEFKLKNAQGFTHGNEKKKLEDDIAKLATKCEEHKAVIEPYRIELERRQVK